MVNASVDATVNGVSFEEALKNNLRSSIVDVFSAEAFSGLVKPIDAEDFASNFAHKIAAAGVGCVAASAKKQDCDAGALGAVVGEMVGDYLVVRGREGDLSDVRKQEITDQAKLVAGTVALTFGVDVDVAANSAVHAVVSNSTMDVFNGGSGWRDELEDEFYINLGVKKDHDALTKYLIKEYGPEVEDALIHIFAPLTAGKGGGIKATAKVITVNGRKIMQIFSNGKSIAYDLKTLSTGIKNTTVNTVNAIKNAAREGLKITSCFVAGTLIQTKEGLKPLETIQVGDLVWSRHEETLEYGFKPVTATSSFEDKEIYKVVVQDSDGNIETYKTTEEHPFWVDDSGWMPASILKAGMKLVDRNNKAITIVSQTKINKFDNVYNFTVDKYHTYHIGELGVWVHNDCLPNLVHSRIDKNKITGYALNPSHHVGGNKVRVFESALGYNQNNADDLIVKVNQGLRDNPAILGKLDNYGQRYTVDMPITGPNGQTAIVRTGWIIDTGKTNPRLTTIYVKLDAYVKNK